MSARVEVGVVGEMMIPLMFGTRLTLIFDRAMQSAPRIREIHLHHALAIWHDKARHYLFPAHGAELDHYKRLILSPNVECHNFSFIVDVFYAHFNATVVNKRFHSITVRHISHLVHRPWGLQFYHL